MQILDFNEDEEVIKKTLKLFGLWDLKVRPLPKVKTPSIMIPIDDSDSHFVSPLYPDLERPMGFYRISKSYGVTPMVTILQRYKSIGG